jgi:hypothetical protein
MKRALKLVAVVAALALMFVVGWGVAKTGVGQAVDPASLSNLEQGFTQRMQNVALVGFFTIDGREDVGGRPERYEIASVTKVDDVNWRFDARITYGSTDVTLPVTVPIVWAGDTPMISIDDFTIPTLGTFTVRLLFYADRYAGSWQHGEYGGLMYGTIEPA